MNDDKIIFMKATLHQRQPDLMGTFGISNLSLLNGLLNFANYRTDDATFKVKWRNLPDDTKVVEEFHFRDATGNGADFRMMGPDVEAIRTMAEVKAIPWQLSIAPSKAKIAEFTQLAGLYAEVEKNFSIAVEHNNLVFRLGNEASHRVSMVFEADVESKPLSGGKSFSSASFLSVLKLAGANPMTTSFFDGGLIGVTIETPFARYEYVIRTV
jgi:hypothetical protein